MKKYILPAGILILLLSVYSCKQVDNFTAYRDVNLIAAQGFDSGDWTADRTESYYMNFEHPAETESLVTTGLPDGTAADGIYRLEIPNLLPNGDFESSTDSNAAAGVQPQGWSYPDAALLTTGTPPNVDVVNSGTYVIDNNTLYYNMENSSYRMDYNLRDGTYGLLDGFITDATYIIRFQFHSGSESSFDYHDGTTSLISDTSVPWVISTGDPAELRHFPDEYINSEITPRQSGAIYFSIGALLTEARRTQSGYIDNIRIVRTDIHQRIRLLVPRTDPDGLRPDIVPGIYRFSVYIKNDPTDTTAGNLSILSKNRMPATAVTLEERLLEDGAPLTLNRYTFLPTAEGADWSGWYQVSFNFTFQFNPAGSSGGEQYMELGITPTDESSGGQGRDAGSILIADPSLVLLPDGTG